MWLFMVSIHCIICCTIKIPSNKHEFFSFKIWQNIALFIQKNNSFRAKNRSIHIYKLFSLAFNSIIPTLLQTKLTQLSVPSSICQWIISFLTDRQQLVRMGKFMSNIHITNTGTLPLRAVFSPHCSSPCTPTTAPLKTPLSSSWSLQTTPHSSASSRTVTSLPKARRLKSWLSGAVFTPWSSTRTSGETPLVSPHSPS